MEQNFHQDQVVKFGENFFLAKIFGYTVHDIQAVGFLLVICMASVLQNKGNVQ